VLEHGELGVRPLRGAAATDHFTLAGTGTETYEPSFTIHGRLRCALGGRCHRQKLDVTGWHRR
jgi:hypothetical protein